MSSSLTQWRYFRSTATTDDLRESMKSPCSSCVAKQKDGDRSPHFLDTSSQTDPARCCVHHAAPWKWFSGSSLATNFETSLFTACESVAVSLPWYFAEGRASPQGKGWQDHCPRQSAASNSPLYMLATVSGAERCQHPHHVLRLQPSICTGSAKLSNAFSYSSACQMVTLFHLTSCW